MVWNESRGLAEPARLLMAYGGISYEDKYEFIHFIHVPN
jgi:hypothetical protein